MNVLLVVADRAIERQLEDFFTARGRQVTVCRSLASARQELESRPFSYVMVDLEVDEDAASLCRVIRELPHADGVYSLVLPAGEALQSMRAALAAGADDYLPKPLDLTALQLRLAFGERRLAARQKRHERQAEESLRFRERYFRSLLENSSDLITIVDTEGHVLYQTPSSQHLLGWKADEMMGWNLIEHVHPEDRERFAATLDKARDAGSTPSVQCRLRRRNGDYGSFESLCKDLLSDPVVGGMVVTSRDISEHRRLEKELTRERVFFQQLFRNSPTGIVILDPDDRIVDANDSFLRLFQYELPEIKRRRINELIVPADLRDESSTLSRVIFSKEPIDHETTRKRRDGSPVEVSILAYPIEVSDRLIGAFAIYTDITQRKQAQRKLYHHAYHDALTGLPNRSLLHHRLERALARAVGQDGYRFALLFIDLDRFKIINDSLGHEAGDELLVEMARRLESCVRPGDTTARLGGDEFTVILEDLNDEQDATRVTDRILASLAEPFHIAGQEVANSGSIGIAYSSPHYRSADELVRDADIAMYHAKAGGKARYEIFDAEMHRSAVRRLQLETDLRRAIENEELELHYQPMTVLATGRIAAFEALVRWPHPRAGLIEARELIPICEETGLILPLGRWVLREASRQVVDWQTRYPEELCLLTVNLSAKQTSRADFLDELDRIREETGAAPSAIGLEMAESLVGPDDKAVRKLLEELKSRGYPIYVDSFGSGHSSLSTLYSLPIDALKIDRSFLQPTDDGRNLEVVRAIAALGASLGLAVVAEGIETKEQLAQMRQLGLSLGQGFLFAKPLPRKQAEELLTGNAS